MEVNSWNSMTAKKSRTKPVNQLSELAHASAIKLVPNSFVIISLV